MSYAKSTIVCILALFLFSTLASAVDTDKLKMSISITSKDGSGGVNNSYAWAGDGTWSAKTGRDKLSLQIQSRYSKSDNGSEYDQLKTWLRYTWVGESPKKWQPVVLISTTGDHDFGEVFTLGAFGFKKNYGLGNVELTMGLSKDVRTADSWAGDVGVLFDLSTRSGKLSAGVKPQSNYDVLGEVRMRDGRFRYTIDTDIGYDIGDNLKAGYRISWSNTTKDVGKIQFFGITYEQ